MRKLWIHRRGVSTMIGGIIMLALFMLALGAMILVTQQFDAYQSVANTMQQKDSDRFSENIVVNDMTLCTSALITQGYSACTTASNSPPDSNFNQYAINISNYGIGVQIARIFINSTQSTSSACYPAPCIFDPANSATANKFRMSDSFLNPDGSFHIVLFWLTNTVALPTGAAANMILLATTRGRLFALQWPLPILGPSLPGKGWGGTGINIGPLVITYETVLVTYSTNQNPTVPIPTGSWTLPTGNQKKIIVFVKIANQANEPVTITKQSLLQIQQYGTTGASSLSVLWLVAPMDTNLCNTFKQNPFNVDLFCGSGPSGRGAISGGNSYPGAGSLGNGKVVAYSTSNAYIVPLSPEAKPGQMVCCGQPIYILFSASSAGDSSADYVKGAAGDVDYSYLEIIFQWDNGSGSYTYGVNLPFIVIYGG
jgi:hypothetical protein